VKRFKKIKSLLGTTIAALTAGGVAMVTTSCDPVDLSELSDAVNFDIVGYEGTDEISMRYIDDSVVGQQKIKIVAYVSSKIIGDFKF
jgi:hypothetical protein